MGLNNFAISCNFHPLAVLGVASVAAAIVAVSCILKLTGKLRRHFVRYSSACHVLWHSTLSVRKMDQMKTLLNFQTLCVRSWVFRFICCLPYFHNYFLVCLRCVVLLFMFLFVFFFTFFCAKKKRSFRFQLFATINNTHDDDDDELDAIYHTRTTLPKIEQSKWLKSENWRRVRACRTA